LYLYSTVAIEKIMAHNPKAKVIVMLRYPADAAHSLHAAGWSHRLESIAYFEEAWRVQQARLAGEYMPPGWPDPATLQYGPMYRYAEQIRRVFAHVPPEQRHIVVYEEFFADPRKHFRQLLQFLQVSPDEQADFPVVNPAMGYRSAWLQRWLRQPPAWLRLLYEPLRPLFRAARVDPAGIAWNLDSAPRAKPHLSPAFRAEIDRYFATDIAELEALLGRPLWRQLTESPTAREPREAAGTATAPGHGRPPRTAPYPRGGTLPGTRSSRGWHEDNL